jgi:hypothetical protein
MDWLRSEDLKEEKVLTTSGLTLTRQEGISLFQVRPKPGVSSAGVPAAVRRSSRPLLGPAGGRRYQTPGCYEHPSQPLFCLIPRPLPRNRNPTLVIPKPGLSARNLLAASSKPADSSRDNAALRNDKPLWGFQTAPLPRDTISVNLPCFGAKMMRHEVCRHSEEGPRIRSQHLPGNHWRGQEESRCLEKAGHLRAGRRCRCYFLYSKRQGKTLGCI